MNEQASKISKPSDSPLIPTKPKRGRPRKNVDLEAVRKLAAKGMTQDRIAYKLGMHPHTLRDRKKEDLLSFTTAIKKGGAEWTDKLLSKAEDRLEGINSDALLIFLLKQEHGAGFTDNRFMTHTGTIKHEHSPAAIAWDARPKDEKVIDITPEPEQIE